MGWCCSFAFTDALSMKYGKNISPIDIAISQGKIQGKDESCFPLTEIVETLNKSHGLCEEQDFSFKEAYDISSEQRDQAQIMSKKVFGADLTSEFWKTNMFSFSKLELLYETSIKNPTQIEDYCTSDKNTAIPFFKNITNLRDIGEVLKQALKQDFQSFLYLMSEKNCKNRISASIEYDKINFSDAESTKKTILSALQNRNPPIISIDVTNLFQVKGRIWSKLTGMFLGNHAVSIVGSRKIGEKCYLKVRDSSFGGLDCTSKKSEAIICSSFENREQMTYEIEANTFIEAARSGLMIK